MDLALAAMIVILQVHCGLATVTADPKCQHLRKAADAVAVCFLVYATEAAWLAAVAAAAVAAADPLIAVPALTRDSVPIQVAPPATVADVAAADVADMVTHGGMAAEALAVLHAAVAADVVEAAAAAVDIADLVAVADTCVA